ncbi:MAG: transglutaminase family protein, partial [Dehalococcoidia bacterium]
MTLHENVDFQGLFAQQVQLDDSELDLDLAALYIAGAEYPSLDVAHYVNLLDGIATDIGEAAAKAGEASTLVDTLNRHFFDLQGYSGNSGDYYDPDNSFL